MCRKQEKDVFLCKKEKGDVVINAIMYIPEWTDVVS